jgi:hypothetical protein
VDHSAAVLTSLEHNRKRWLKGQPRVCFAGVFARVDVRSLVVLVHGSFPAAVLWPGTQPSEGGCGAIRAVIKPALRVRALVVPASLRFEGLRR